MRQDIDSTPCRNLKEICSFLSAMDLETEIRKLGYNTRKRKLPVTEQLALWVQTIWGGSGDSLGIMAMKRNPNNAGRMALTEQALSYADCHRPYKLFADLFGRLVKKANRPLRRRIKKLEINALDASVIKGLAPKVARFFSLRNNNGAVLARLKVHALVNVEGAPRALKITGANNNDGQHTDFIWRRVRRKTLLIFDLGYWRFDFLDTIQDRGAYFLTRVRADNRPIALTWFRRGRNLCDYEARLDRYRSNRKRHTARVIEQRQADGSWWRWTTNLNARQFPAEEVIALYRSRWQVEIFFRQLKHVFHLKRLRSTNRNAVLTELYMTFIAYLLAHWLMAETARRHPQPPKRQYCLVRIVRLLYLLLEKPMLPMPEVLNFVALYCLTPVNKKRQTQRSPALVA